MPNAIRLALSVDHQKKKTKVIVLPFSIYLHFVTSSEFEVILPQDLQERCVSLKMTFLQENQFFSHDYAEDYNRAPYIRFLTGPDVHRFFAKVLSLNFQAHQHMLKEKAGSFGEFFSDLSLFWNKKYQTEIELGDEDVLRQALFCLACIQTQYARIKEKEDLRSRLSRFAKNELAERERELNDLNQKLKMLEGKNEELKVKCSSLEGELHREKETKIVLVPADPYHMLGLSSGHEEGVSERAKNLMKALHPDKSGTPDTAYLFDMVLKARKMIQSMD